MLNEAGIIHETEDEEPYGIDAAPEFLHQTTSQNKEGLIDFFRFC